MGVSDTWTAGRDERAARADGRPVRVTFTSEDVLHSLYFPAFRVKADAIPGRYGSVWFEATQTG